VRLSALAYAHAHQTAGHSVWATVIAIVWLLAMPVVSVWFLWRSDGGPDDPGGDGGSGGGPPEPPPPPPPTGPAWWPEFEREFAAYVARDPAQIVLIEVEQSRNGVS
jgi:hypothetical protein